MEINQYCLALRSELGVVTIPEVMSPEDPLNRRNYRFGLNDLDHKSCDQDAGHKEKEVKADRLPE